MISSIANICLIISIFFAVISIFSLLLGKNIDSIKNSRFYSDFATHCIVLHTISIITAFLLLVSAFCLSDFSVKNVFLNSSSIMPMIFKISGAWASHEGSLLLWFSFVTICSSFVALKKEEFQEYKIFILSIILFLLSCFIYFTANPFEVLYIKPHQGVGLNPLLQDIALSIHPPILYMGYASYIGVFVYSIMALLRPNLATIYSKNALTYSKFGWITILAGVGLGSWWAYRELGWGGYWFFDPVENISLVPLMMAISYHHCLIFSMSKQNLMRWTLFLGINIFPFTVFGSFLVRSGLLVSVHSFASAVNIEFLFFIFAVIFCVSNFLYAVRYKLFYCENKSYTFKEKGIFYGNIIWLASIIIILFSIIYPIIIGFLGNTISIKIEYFYYYFLPLIIPLMLLAGSFAYFKYGIKSFSQFYLTAVLSFGLCIYVYWIKNLDGKLLFLAIFSSLFLIISTIVKFVEKTQICTSLPSRKMTSMLLGHFGFGLLAFSVIVNSALQKEIDFIGKVGESILDPNYYITLKKITFGDNDNYYYQKADFLVEDNNKRLVILSPENRLYKIENALTAESDIFSDFVKDIYIILNKIDGEIIHAKIYHRPCMKILWLSVVIILTSGIISLTDRKKHNAK